MAWTVEFLLSAQRQIQKLDRSTQHRITSYFHDRVLKADDPRQLAKMLRGEKATPTQALAFLMEQHGLRQKDLVPILGTRSTVSEVMSGKRDLSKAQIRRLSDFFHVSPEIFF